MASSFLVVADGRVSWNPTFRRDLQDWELGDIGQLFELFYAQSVKGIGADRVVWAGTKNRVFSVKSYYLALKGSNGLIFPWKAVWKTKAPNRVAFFAWEAAREAILTGDNLRKRRKIYVNGCVMCKRDGESVNHLLLHCPVAWEVWNYLFRLANISWVMP